MRLFFYFLIIFFIQINSIASIEKNIINNFLNLQNINFDFNQTIQGKDERGNCTISYPMKIYCKYNSRHEKILVSNGKSLVIKSKKNQQYFIYPLKETPLFYLLDKNFLINEIGKSKAKIIDDKYYTFSINKKNQKINIFFKKEDLSLIGWQTEDIYQNLSVTYIYNIKLNKNIDENVFKLPKTF